MKNLLKHIKNLLKIFALICLDLPITLLTFIVVPVSLLFVSREDNHLPKWVRWWETYDNDINGDGNCVPLDGINEENGCDPTQSGAWKGHEHSNGKYRNYIWRLRWLIRNPANTWAYDVLGFKIKSSVQYKVWGDVKTSNRNPGHEGWLYCEAHQDDKIIPCYYLVKRWGSSDKCLRIYLGWKIKSSDENLNNWDKSGIAQFVWSINPFMGYKE